MVAELIREAALEGVRDELPHSIAVVVEEMGLREGRPEDRPLLDIHANLYVERSSQKGIIIGKGGARLREVGTNARKQIEALLGTRSTSTCTSRSPRTGSATRSSSQAGLLRRAVLRPLLWPLALPAAPKRGPSAFSQIRTLKWADSPFV